MSLRIATLASILLLVVACSNTPAPSGPGTGSGPSAPPSSVPPAVPSGTPAPSTQPVPSAVPSASPVASPSDSPAPTFSAAEGTLLEALRVDARINCAPRRADLPAGAVAGIECHVGSALVDRVGVYGFDGSLGSGSGSASTALAAYLARLASAGVKPASGDCKTGTAGDASWPAYLPDEGDDGGLRAERAGCYVDADGTANVRLTCYGEIYLGVLGTSGDLAALNAWTWKVADGESVHRDPPGLCAAAD